MATDDELLEGLTESTPLAPAEPVDATEVTLTDELGRELVLTERGALTREDIEARAAAGMGLGLVSEEELAAEALEEQERAVFDAPLETFVERGVSAAFLGLPDVLRSGESAYEARKRAMYNPGAALAGELTGAVAPTLLSGGAGVGGTLARLTPMGRLSAATGRIASRGGLRGAVTGGMLEGAAQAAGDYVARVSLDEDADFSAEALASALLKGGALGGAAGASARGLQRTLEGGAARLIADPRAALAQAVPGPDPMLAASLGVRKRPLRWSSFKGVVRRRLAQADAPQARKLGEAIDSAAARPVARELDEVLSSAQMAAVREADAGAVVLEEAARKAAREFGEAAADARSWWSRFAQAADMDHAKVKITRQVDDAVMDEGGAVVARLDEAKAAFDDHLAELRARTGMPGPTPAPVNERLSAASKKLRQSARETRRGGIREPIEAALGAGELARDVGVDTGLPSARDVPIIGDLMGAYLRFRGISAAARGLAGRLPGSRATAAAERVVSSERSIGEKMRSLAAGTMRAAARRDVPRAATKAIAQQIREVLDADPAVETTAAHQAMAETTSAVQAATAAATERALGYLQAKAPRDPMPQRLPGMREWEPTAAQARAWERRVRAVLDPADALDVVLTNAGAVLELEVLREVHPRHWLEAQEAFRADLATLREKLPRAKYHALGRALGVPTSAAQMPRYPRPAVGAAPGPGTTPPTPAPTTGAPSRAASLEEVES